MSQRTTEATTLDPVAAMRSVRDANIEAWSKIMRQWTSSDAYSQATSGMLEAYMASAAPVRKLVEQTMTQVLAAYNIPLRSDVTRLAERLTSIELRLDDIEAQLGTLQRGADVPTGDLVNEQGQTLHVKNVPSAGSTRRMPKTKE